MHTHARTHAQQLSALNVLPTSSQHSCPVGMSLTSDIFTDHKQQL